MIINTSGHSNIIQGGVDHASSAAMSNVFHPSTSPSLNFDTATQAGT